MPLTIRRRRFLIAADAMLMPRPMFRPRLMTSADYLEPPVPPDYAGCIGQAGDFQLTSPSTPREIRQCHMLRDSSRCLFTGCRRRRVMLTASPL